jgi:hypothetical protein
VSTASARYTTPGMKGPARLVAIWSSMQASGPAEAIRAGQANGQPRHPVPRASAHCFLAGGSGVSRGGQKAAEPVEILVVLPEQGAGEPVGRIRPWNWPYSSPPRLRVPPARKLSFVTTSPATRVDSYGRSFALPHAFAVNPRRAPAPLVQ